MPPPLRSGAGRGVDPKDSRASEDAAARGLMSFATLPGDLGCMRCLCLHPGFDRFFLLSLDIQEPKH